MNDHLPITVLLVASPGPLRSALQALIGSFPQISVVEIAVSIETILELLSTYSPDLVVLIAETQPEWVDLPGAIRSVAPTIPIIILANGETGPTTADLVLQQGARPEELIAKIELLLNNRKKQI